MVIKLAIPNKPSVTERVPNHIIIPIRFVVEPTYAHTPLIIIAIRDPIMFFVLFDMVI